MKTGMQESGFYFVRKAVSRVLKDRCPVIFAGVLVLLIIGSCHDSGPPENSVTPPPPPVPIDLVKAFAVSPESTGNAPIKPPRINSERNAVIIPFGSRLEYHLDLFPGCVLATRDTRVRRSATGELKITWTPDGSSSRLITPDLSTTEHRSVSLGISRQESGLLTMEAGAEGESTYPGGGIVLFDPVIRPKDAHEAEEESASNKAKGMPNIIVYLADALRRDHLGCYGYGRAVSPRIDEFARDSILFSDAQAQSSWTRPSAASIFTGLWPQQHRATNKKAVLPDEAETLAEILRRRGYQTAAVVGNGNLSNVFGFSQGFSYYRYMQNMEQGRPVPRSEEINEAVFRWLDLYHHKEPFFLYVHTVDPHLPYDPEEPFRSRYVSHPRDPSFGKPETIAALARDKSKVTPEIIRDLVDLYDAEIAANDAAFGRFLDELKKKGLYDSSIIVFLSDHGEEFFDHKGWSHGHTLHSEVLNIPLVIHVPGIEGGATNNHLVDHVGLFATLLDFAGITELPRSTMGRSFRSLFSGESSDDRHRVSISHLDMDGLYSLGLIEGRWKLILRRRQAPDLVPELYDRVADPGEMHDLSTKDPRRTSDMKARLEEANDSCRGILEQDRVDAKDDEEMKAQLKALGYIEE